MNTKEASVLLNLANLLPAKAEDILAHFKDIGKLITASESDLKDIVSLTARDRECLFKIRDKGILDKELKMIKDGGVAVIDIFDENYPALLKEISHPPLLIYVEGNLEVFNKFSFAIVGTRIPTVYGMAMAEEFSYKLSSLGLVIVSGLARGIDSAAHRGAVKKGESIAVLGSGLYNLYPKENRKLADQICQRGAVISEFPLRYPPLRENFPRRNRIISGLSKGVLVVEAAVKSGALITAHYALEQNREVFAIPGKADSPLSRGAHVLIKEGAKLVDSVEDILEDLNIEFLKEKGSCQVNLDSREKLIFDLIDKEGTSLEEIIVKSKLSRPSLNTVILDLQLMGLIREVRPAFFSRLA